MDTRETKLKKRVQRLERQRKRVRFLPIPQKYRVKRAKALDAKIRQAKVELARYRESKLTGTQRLAKQVREHRNTRCDNFRTSDGRTAGDDLDQFVRENRVWNAQTQRYVVLDPGPLRATLRMARFGEVKLNCLSNGTHSGPSSPFPSGTHPRGKGGDWDYGSEVSNERMASCVREEGGVALQEPGHVHGSWR